MIDIKAIRAAAEAATPIYTDLLGDRYFGNDHSTATLTKAQDDFISTANPATIIALLDRLEAAEVEVIEQARLLGISAEKELALMAKLEAAEKDAARYQALAEPAAEPMPSEQITDHIRSIDIDLREDLCSFSFRSGVRWAEKQHGIGGG